MSVRFEGVNASTPADLAFALNQALDEIDQGGQRRVVGVSFTTPLAASGVRFPYGAIVEVEPVDAGAEVAVGREALNTVMEFVVETVKAGRAGDVPLPAFNHLRRRLLAEER